jgi:flagellar biogenesis protein FliO
LFLPALALAGLAGAAFVLGRRRAKRPSAIKILETASLGPRRALVLAEIEGETMLLGSSEAGITMLRALPGRAATTAAAPRPEAASALEARVEPDQAGYLSRLFKRPEASAAPVAGAEAPSEGDKAFDEIFRESLEDEDLRRRLAAGLPGKVS